MDPEAQAQQKIYPAGQVQTIATAFQTGSAQTISKPETNNNGSNTNNGNNGSIKRDQYIIMK